MKVPAWFINLARAEGRARHMIQEAERVGFDLQRLEAVDGQAIDPANRSAQNRPATGMHQLSLPEFACFLSHRTAWGRIVESDARYGAVFEDDLTFAADAAQLLGDDAWIPEEAHIIKVETTHRKALLAPPFVGIGHSRTLAQLASRHLGGGGYILSKHAAEHLIAATEIIHAPVDYILFDPDHMVLQNVPRWQVYPAICVQQVRTRESFLPEDAETSGLDASRSPLKRRGLAKLGRELVRPFAMLLGELAARVRAIRIGGRWRFIRFRR